MASGSEPSKKSIVLYKAEQTEPIPPFRDQTRLHLTVKMLMEAFTKPRDQGRLVINNTQVYAVQLCGMLTSIEHGDGWTDYVLYDGTGSIAGRTWSRDPEGWTDMSAGVKGKYYIINGTLATRYEVLKIDTITAREVTDHNEITVHNLTVIHEYLSLKDRHERIQQPQVTFNKARLELDKEGILDVLSEDAIRATEEGASENHLMEALNLKDDEMREALDALLNEGSIYNTTDDKHYKLADN